MNALQCVQVLLAVGLLVSAGCQGTPGPQPPPSARPPGETAKPTPAAAVPGTASDWSCLGNPPDVAPGWKLEMAAAPLGPGALETAMRNAQSKLKSKICVNAQADQAVADACQFLASKIEPWKTGRNDREACASAVVKREYMDQWQALATDLAGFDARLAASAKQLTGAAPSKKIALAAVYDDGGADPKQNQLPGGRRGDWLASRFRAAFGASGGLVATPKGWADGQPAPAGTDLVVVGRMFKRTTVALPMIDVTWTAYTHDGHQIESASGSFPEAAAPAGPAFTPPAIPITSGLFVSMDSDHAGSICSGEITQVWLKSNEEMHVRVFDLYGKNGAMLIFPPNPSVSDVVPAGHTIPLGDAKGFEAIPAPGSAEERYLAIAAPNAAGLGRFGGAKGYCRLETGDAAALHRGDALPPGAKVAVTGFRVLSGAGCPKAPTDEHIQSANDAIERLPICPR